MSTAPTRACLCRTDPGPAKRQPRGGDAGQPPRAYPGRRNERQMMAAKKKNNSKSVDGGTSDFYWPGPTRLYDPDVGCGAVLLTIEQAYSVALAIGEAIRSGEFEETTTRRMVQALSIIDHTFRLNIGIDPLPAGTDVTWCGEPWKVAEWQPHNGIGGCYHLINAAGQSATASPDEIE